MKKTIAIVAALAVSLFSVNAFAQEEERESYFLNHWSVGVSLIGDFHVSVATTIFPNLQFRAMYSTLTPHLALANAITKNKPNIGPINPYHNVQEFNKSVDGVNIKSLDIVGSVQSRDLNLLLDFYPAKGSKFHLTAGAIISFTPDLVKASVTALDANGNPALKPDADGNGLVSFGNVTPNPEGVINARVAYGLNKVRPYVGIGIGRPVATDKRVSVNFDLGVAYVGGVKVFSEGYMNNWPNAEVVEINQKWMETTKLPDSNKTVKEEIGEKTAGYIESANTFPVLPYFRLTLNVRLF